MEIQSELFVHDYQPWPARELRKGRGHFWQGPGGDKAQIYFVRIYGSKGIQPS